MSIFAALLHYANSNPPICHRQEFYALKARLLGDHGTLLEHQVQQITHHCLGERNYDGDFAGCVGKWCPKCHGTGIFSRRWIRLGRWQWGKYGFHVPVDQTYFQPLPWPEKEATIFGRLHHPDYGRLSNEAVLWLFLLCGEWRLFWRQMTGGYCCGWYWWPMLNMQRVATKLSMWLSWRKCWCGRWFPTWGTGWCVCRKCRKPQKADPGIPF